MRVFKEEGIILKRKNIGEADRILTVFTKKSGKIRVKAPSVRKITSRRAPHIELINLVKFTLYKSSHSFLPIVTEALMLKDFSSLKKNLRKVGFAYYICELVDAFCPENQENRNIFSLLDQTFTKLSLELDNRKIIEDFEKELLFSLGFWSKAQALRNNNYEKIIESILERKLRTKRLIQLLHEH